LAAIARKTHTVANTHLRGTWVSYLWLVPAAVLGLAVAQLPILALGRVIATGIVIAAILAHPIAVFALLLVLSPLRTLYATEAPRLGYPSIPLDIGQWLVIALIASWLLHCIRRRRLPFFFLRREVNQTGAALLPLILFVAAAAASGFTAVSLSAWLIEWLKWLQIVIIAIIAIDLCIAGHRQSIIGLLVLAGATNAAIGVYQYFGGSGALHLLINERNFRAFGTFGQPNPFGGFMGVLFPLAFTSLMASLWAGYKKIRDGGFAAIPSPLLKSAFFGAGALLMAVALFMSWSRGAWLGFGVSIAVMLFALPRRAVHSLLLALALMGIMAGLAASGRLPASITARLGTITEDIFNVQDVRGVDITPANYAVVERLAHWQAAFNMATERPWLGVGLGNYEVAYPEYRLANWKFALGHAHNMFLNMLAEVGTLGLITYAAFICAILWYAWRVRRHPVVQSRLTAVGILGVWTYIIVHSLTDNLYVNNVFIHLSVTIGLLASLLREIPSQTSR
jgi:O-antigen ligase